MSQLYKINLLNHGEIIGYLLLEFTLFSKRVFVDSKSGLQVEINAGYLVCGGGVDIGFEGHDSTFWEAGDVLYFHLGAGFPGVSICKKFVKLGTFNTL